MANENTCLKRLCIVFNAVLGLLGGTVLTLGAIVYAYQEKVEKFNKEASSGVTLFCFFGTVTLLISLLGIYGAYKEKRIPLRMYLGILFGGIIVILYFIVQMTSLKSKTNGNLDAEFKELMPLNSAAHELQESIGKFQTVFECCGFFGYKDWSDEIPESCKCP
ncbi:CD82 antigen-like [Arapaima gigas]